MVSVGPSRLHSLTSPLPSHSPLFSLPQLIPGLSTTSWFTTVCPLAFVLIFNAGKEIYDDYHRHK